MGFPGGTVVENLFANAGDTGDLGLIAGLGRAPGEGNGNPLVFLPGKSHGQRSLVGYSPWVCKQSDMTDHTHPHTHTQRGIENCQNARLLTGTLTPNFNVGLCI